MAGEIVANWAPGAPPLDTGRSIDAQLAEAIEETVQRYSEPRSALLPVLWVVQRHLGWLPPDVMAWIGRRLAVGPAVVDEVASFYDMFRREEPALHVVELCGSLPCHLCGCGELLNAVERRLGVRRGRSADGEWEVRTVQCLGRCDSAPTVVVDGVVHRSVSAEELEQLLDARG